ncbi:MAG: hypothetical protein NTAFB01_14120 [Nitrospira sp.]
MNRETVCELTSSPASKATMQLAAIVFGLRKKSFLINKKTLAAPTPIESAYRE